MVQSYSEVRARLHPESLTWRSSVATIAGMMNNVFKRREVGGILYYSCPAFDALPLLRHAFSTRIGPDGPFNLTVRPGFAPEQVQKNRLQLMHELGLPGLRLITLSQIHSDRVHVLDADVEDLDRRREGDAVATRLTRIALAVQVADCFPVLLVDRESGSIAAVHSGWRGTASRILKKTVTQIQEKLGGQPAAMMVAIGPGIRSCCMQVGPEVALLYERTYPDCGISSRQPSCQDRYLLDIPAALSIQCAEAGIPDGQVFDCGLCTRCLSEEFFSHRGEGDTAGRMMGIIGFSGPG